MRRMAGGIDWGDIEGVRGDFAVADSGVVQSSIHFTGDEIIVKDTMPAHHVQTIIDDVSRLRDRIRARRPGGDLVGHIPITLWYTWRKAWARGPKLHGVTWRAFFAGKFMDRDYSKFRAGNL